MEPPGDIHLPFFAYGVFRPGQLGYFQLRDSVGADPVPGRVRGSLLLRDGLPIVDPDGPDEVEGWLLTFDSARTESAYARIAGMEPDEHYKWLEIEAEGKRANLLAGRSPKKGSVAAEVNEWNCWDDPLFTAALDVVQETLEAQDFSWDLKPLFRIQMAYLLLWSSIERYVSLRYHLGNKVNEKVGNLAKEPAFADGVKKHVTEPREVYRADRPRKKVVLVPDDPNKALDYYYQVRSNITHRGKAVVKDYERVRDSLAELLPIFREVLKAAELEAAL